MVISASDKEGNEIKACIEHPLYRKFDVYDENGKIEAFISFPSLSFISI